MRVLVIRSAIATGTRNAQNIVLSIRVSTDGEIVASISWRSGGKAVGSGVELVGDAVGIVDDRTV